MQARLASLSLLLGLVVFAIAHALLVPSDHKSASEPSIVIPTAVIPTAVASSRNDDTGPSASAPSLRITVEPVATIEPQPLIYWLFAHPDDESLAAGAAIRQAQKDGVRNVVVIFTTGENTAVRGQLGLSVDQTIASRRAETRDSMGVIGVTDVRFFDTPDGSLTAESVSSFIEAVVAAEPGPVSFRGHSPYDSYLNLPCGHPDHCTIGNVLLSEWRAGVIAEPRFYRLGQLFGAPEVGDCATLGPEEAADEALMRLAYAFWNPSVGRYAIGSRSVAGPWKATATEPECSEGPH